jgi:outer membrane protein TolC
MLFYRSLFRFGCTVAAGLAVTTSFGQTNNASNAHTSFNISSVYAEINQPADDLVAMDFQADSPWWDQHVSHPQREELEAIPADIHSLMYLAVKYSKQIRIAAQNPLIRETAITEADSDFDWVRYLDTAWNDTSEPVSNSLTVGGGQDRFNEETFQFGGGIRKRTRTGGFLDIGQTFGFQDNNSNFFIPRNQANGRFTISYSQPLLRGRGRAYNNSLVLLANIDAGVAHDEFKATLQTELLEVARSYYALYQERAYLAQQVRLYLKTKDIVDALQARQAIDAQRTQYVLASSALESRRSELIRSRTAVINAETRLRGLINAPELRLSDEAELVPQEFPTQAFIDVNLRSQLQLAAQHRPEIMAAIKEVKAGSTRLGVAEHELLPVLNLVTQGFLSGLEGDSDFGQAFVNQFSEGAPSYSVGLQYEFPIGNRLARSRMCRRRIEMRQLQSQYEQALAAVETEVDIAVRELTTSYQEIKARKRALSAAEAEAETIEIRWQRMVDGSGQSGLNLESLLRAQERVTQAEREYVTSVLTYNLAMINLRRANGTLLIAENVSIDRTCDNCAGKDLIVNKGQPNSNVHNIGVPVYSAPVSVEQPIETISNEDYSQAPPPVPIVSPDAFVPNRTAPQGIDPSAAPIFTPASPAVTAPPAVSLPNPGGSPYLIEDVLR